MIYTIDFNERGLLKKLFANKKNRGELISRNLKTAVKGIEDLMVDSNYFTYHLNAQGNFDPGEIYSYLCSNGFVITATHKIR